MTRFIGILWRQGREGHSTWGMTAEMGSIKELIFFLPKVRSEELKVFNILRACELKFELNLGCTTENSLKFWQIPLAGVKIDYFLLTDRV